MKAFELAELLLQYPNREVYIEVPYNDTWEGAFETRVEKLDIGNVQGLGVRTKEPKTLITWDK